MSEFIAFKKFITPPFIMIIYIIGALVITIGSIVVMAAGYTVPGQASTSGAAGVVVGLVLLIFGNLFWRIFCEYMIVQFRIYDELVMLNHRFGGPAPQTTAPAPPPAAATPTCPTCGSPLRYIQQYQRWYCDKEQKYV
jgi:hypothetical protein